MKPFFFVGSRRSGTTLVCHIINYHPQLYVPFERYIMWILYGIKTTGVIQPPPCGALAPMLITLEQSGKAFLNYIQSDFGVAATRTAFFSAINNCRMKRVTGSWRKDLVAIGEKNPPEYTNLGMQKFILEMLPEARFIHVVRHPAAVTRSQVGFRHRRSVNNDFTVPVTWKADRENHYRVWIEVEQRILQMDVPMLTIRYEDLVIDPVGESRKLYEFLGVHSSDYIDARIKHNVNDSGNSKYDLSTPGIAGLEELMVRYRYG